MSGADDCASLCVVQLRAETAEAGAMVVQLPPRRVHLTVVGETYSDHGGVESVCRENRRVRCAMVETAQGTIASQQAGHTTTPSPRAAARYRRR